MRSTTTSASTKDLVEVLYIELVNPVEHFEDLIRFFFSFHDPTTLNRQGADRGLAYASFIFCADLEQLEIANRVKTELQRRIDCGCVNCFQGRESKPGWWKLQSLLRQMRRINSIIARTPRDIAIISYGLEIKSLQKSSDCGSLNICQLHSYQQIESCILGATLARPYFLDGCPSYIHLLALVPGCLYQVA